MKSKRLHCLIPLTLFVRLQRIADREGESVTSVVRRALRAYVAHDAAISRHFFGEE